MKVITKFGLGNVFDWKTGVEVLLDKPFLGSLKMRLEKSEIFHFGPMAVVRILNVEGARLLSGGIIIKRNSSSTEFPICAVSNVQFFHSRIDALDNFFNAHLPKNETRFLLDIKSGLFKAENLEDNLKIQANNYILLKPHIDCWSPERSTLFYDINSAKEGFENGSTAGVNGISTSILIELAGKRMLGVRIAVNPPTGVVFEKRYY